MADITVIIPAYNCESTIQRALNSVATQDVPPSRVLVIDDCSTDSTYELAADSHLPLSVEVVRLHVNSGPGSARQTGLEMSTSEYTSFLDADDEWHPAHLARSLESLRLAPLAAATYSSAILVRDSAPPWSNHRRRYPQPLQFERLVTTNPIVQSSVVARTSALRAVGGYRRAKRHAEDYDLWLRLAVSFPIVQTGVEQVRRYNSDGQLSLSRKLMVRGKWEALTYFREWGRSNVADWEAISFDHLVEKALDTDMRFALADWDRDLLRTIVESAGLVSPGSARVQYWERWLRYVWPMLRAARYFVREIPQSVRASRTLRASPSQSTS